MIGDEARSRRCVPGRLASEGGCHERSDVLELGVARQKLEGALAHDGVLDLEASHERDASVGLAGDHGRALGGARGVRRARADRGRNGRARLLSVPRPARTAAAAQRNATRRRWAGGAPRDLERGQARERGTGANRGPRGRGERGAEHADARSVEPGVGAEQFVGERSDAFSERCLAVRGKPTEPTRRVSTLCRREGGRFAARARARPRRPVRPKRTHGWRALAKNPRSKACCVRRRGDGRRTVSSRRVKPREGLQRGRHGRFRSAGGVQQRHERGIVESVGARRQRSERQSGRFGELVRCGEPGAQAPLGVGATATAEGKSDALERIEERRRARADCPRSWSSLVPKGSPRAARARAHSRLRGRGRRRRGRRPTSSPPPHRRRRAWRAAVVQPRRRRCATTRASRRAGPARHGRSESASVTPALARRCSAISSARRRASASGLALLASRAAGARRSAAAAFRHRFAAASAQARGEDRGAAETRARRRRRRLHQPASAQSRSHAPCSRSCRSVRRVKGSAGAAAGTGSALEARASKTEQSAAQMPIAAHDPDARETERAQELRGKMGVFAACTTRPAPAGAPLRAHRAGRAPLRARPLPRRLAKAARR